MAGIRYGCYNNAITLQPFSGHFARPSRIYQMFQYVSKNDNVKTLMKRQNSLFNVSAEDFIKSCSCFVSHLGIQFYAVYLTVQSSL